MQLIRSVRTLVPLLMLGFFGCVLGCSGESTKTPEEAKAHGAMMKEDRRNAMKEQAAARKSRQGRRSWDDDRSPATPGGSGLEEGRRAVVAAPAAL
jgi:hypothetical protein